MSDGFATFKAGFEKGYALAMSYLHDSEAWNEWLAEAEDDPNDDPNVLAALYLESRSEFVAASPDTPEQDQDHG
ncbi:MAG TPA: hypothetical protein VIV56_01860 [Gemmatimonadales bacterium]